MLGTTTPLVNGRVQVESSSVDFSTRVTEETISTVDFSNERETHSTAYACGINTENPFTYMATLSRKWDESKHNASHVQGKIKVSSFSSYFSHKKIKIKNLKINTCFF